MENYAYITFLSTDSYIYYVIGLAESLKNSKAKYPLYCACTANLSENTLKILKRCKIPYIIVDTCDIDSIVANSLLLGMKQNWAMSTPKLSIFKLTQFTKCVFLDADVKVCHNIDDLFSYPHMASVEDMAPENHPEHFNYKIGNFLFYGGIFVFEPSLNYYDKIKNAIKAVPKNIKWNDQNILAYLNQDWMTKKELHLPCEYLINLSPEVYSCYLRHGTDDSIKVKHFGRHKNIPYTKEEKIEQVLYNNYYDYFLFLNDIINKYKLPLQKLNMDNIVCEGKSNIDYSVNDGIDVVIPYVDCNDSIWQENYRATTSEAIDVKRFRSWNSLRFLLRGIEQNVPYVRTVHLIVSNVEQIPSWLDRSKVHVVLHSEIIPKKHLPTFSSPCIEMFLHNIPNLSEKFIYLNDDIFFISPINETEWFCDNKINCILLTRDIKKEANFWENTVYNTYNLVKRKFDDSEQTTIYKKPPHGAIPMLKSNLLAAQKIFKKEIADSINQFRTDKDINQYIYTYYAYFTHQLNNNYIGFKYFNSEKQMREIIRTIKNKEIKSICINDADFTDISSVVIDLSAAFLSIFPTKSKYELSDVEPCGLPKKHPTTRVYSGRPGYYLAF